MDLRLLQYFVQVVDDGSITGAAKKLHMTQPPLSAQIKKFENSLGVQLFVRSQNMQLTEAGKHLRKRADQIFDLLDRTESELTEIARGMSGVLAIGTLPIAAKLFLSEWIIAFTREYPKVSFNVMEGDSARLAELLDRHIIEIATLRMPIDEQKYDYIPLLVENVVLAVSKNQSVCDINRSSIPLAEVDNMDLIVPMRHDWVPRDLLLSTKGNSIYYCQNLIAGLMLASEGLGAAIVSENARLLWDKDDLIFLTITEPITQTTSALVWLKDTPMSEFCQNFIKLLSDFKPLTGLRPLQIK